MQPGSAAGTLTVDACTDSSGQPVKVEIAVISGADTSCTGTAEFDDLRLTGEYVPTPIMLVDSDGEGFSDAFVDARDTRITNAEGSWSGREVFYVGYAPEDGDPVEVFAEARIAVLLGDGAYDGLAAILREQEAGESPLGETPLVGVIIEVESVE